MNKLELSYIVGDDAGKGLTWVRTEAGSIITVIGDNTVLTDGYPEQVVAIIHFPTKTAHVIVQKDRFGLAHNLHLELGYVTRRPIAEADFEGYENVGFADGHATIPDILADCERRYGDDDCMTTVIEVKPCKVPGLFETKGGKITLVGAYILEVDLR